MLDETELIKFLKEEKGLLIHYPLIYDKYAISAAIQPQRNFSGKPFLVMTQHSEIFKKVHSFPDDFFTENNFVSYLKPSGKTNAMLKMASQTGAYLLIDDIVEFHRNQLWTVLKDSHQNTKLLILVNHDVSNEIIEKVKNELNIKFETFCNFTNENIVLNFKRQKSKLSKQQLNHLELKKEEPCKNFLYMKDLLESKERVDSDISKGGWINSSLLSLLHIHSPKFLKLLTNLNHDVNFKNKKHLIISSYSDRHGLNIISTLLNYMNISNIILNNENDCNEFNSGENQEVALICSKNRELLKKSLNHVYGIHVLDNFNYDDVNDIIEYMIKRKNYDIIRYPVNFYFYLTDDVKDKEQYEINLKGILIPKIESHLARIKNMSRLITKGSQGLHLLN